MIRRIPGNRVVTTTITHGPNPLTVAMVAALDSARGLAASGRLGMVRAGRGGRGSRFSGDLGPRQSFRGAGPVELRNLRTGKPMALPIANVPKQGRR